MADWSQLPKDLLHQISEHLDSPLYLLRFRSVCSSWRSSISPSSSFPIPHFPFKFPLLSNDPSPSTSTFSLSQRSLFLLTPPSSHSHLHSWLIKTGRDPRGRTLLFHPLSRFPIKPTPFPSHSQTNSDSNSNSLLDINDLHVFDLGQEFVLGNATPHSFNSLYMEKVIFSAQKDNFALLTIHVSGKLALFRSGDESWTIIPEMPTPYDDVCVFKGKLFAVDSTGRTVSVGSDSSLDFVAGPVFGGDKKFLVVCDGELWLVDKYLSSDYLCGLGVFEEDDEEDEIYELGCERAVKFEVYRLEEEECRWVEMVSLGEWVLFLGDDCAFSANARDLGVGEGDCLVFRDDTFNVNALESGLGVFHYGEGRISPLAEYPRYSKLFWPPPDWVGLR